MFTTDPTLSQRIERMIGQTPVIDAHAHLTPVQPQAADLAALLREPPIHTALIGAGRPSDDSAETLPVDEQVRRALPYLARIRNTAAAWCLQRILRDLYDFHDPELTDTNYQSLIDKVAATGRDASWAFTVLRDRAKIQRLVTSREPGTEPGASETTPIDYRVNLHDLFRPGGGPATGASFVGHPSREEYYPALTELLGEAPGTALQLERLLFDWLSRTLCGRTRFACARFPLDRHLHRPDPFEVDTVLGRASGGGIPLADAEVDTLIGFVIWTTLAWHHEHGRALQLALSLSARPSPTDSHPGRIGFAELTHALSHFTRARFELMASTEPVAQEVSYLCVQYPNAYAAGCWGHILTPGGIARTTGLRASVVPMTKFSAFLSDAATAEWAYARAVLARKAIASAFARLVEAGYYEEEDLPPILLQIFHDTPCALYDLPAE